MIKHFRLGSSSFYQLFGWVKWQTSFLNRKQSNRLQKETFTFSTDQAPVGNWRKVAWQKEYQALCESTWGWHRERTAFSRMLSFPSAPPKSHLKRQEACFTFEEVLGLEAPGGLDTRCCRRSSRGGTGGRVACGATENGEGGRSTWKRRLGKSVNDKIQQNSFLERLSSSVTFIGFGITTGSRWLY